MTGWTRDPRPSQANHHNLGTGIELAESVPKQIPAQQTPTSPEGVRHLTQSATHGRDTTTQSHTQRLRSWWSHTIRLTLDHGASPQGADFRDHLALERTFLSWFRTSVALISFGVVITQLFLLHHVAPKRGKILGVVMACGGIAVVLLGCLRYFRQQRLLVQGKTLSGGWHHWGLLSVLSAVLMALLVLVIVDG